MDKSGIRRPLRTHLQANTKAVHDSLDASVSRSDWMEPAVYARFLACQLGAREPIDRWAALHCPPDLRPPETGGLLRADLRDMGWNSDSIAGGPFALPADADPLGLAWAIAGSQMGNKAMLVRLKKVSGGERNDLPVRFLSDPRMQPFWQSLLPRLRRELSADEARPAIGAALAVFARFDEVFTGYRARSAAA